MIIVQSLFNAVLSDFGFDFLLKTKSYRCLNSIIGRYINTCWKLEFIDMQREFLMVLTTRTWSITRNAWLQIGISQLQVGTGFNRWSCEDKSSGSLSNISSHMQKFRALHNGRSKAVFNFWSLVFVGNGSRGILSSSALSETNEQSPSLRLPWSSKKRQTSRCRTP